MAQKTYKQIQDEADRMFGKGASREKFEWRRQQQAAAGLELEQKTRGGAAGVYDRNKKLVSAAATAAGFLMGGPAGAGLARGAVQGLDRPGEGGIGFDVRRGAKGFTEGYGAGSVAKMGQAGLQRLFAPGAAPVPTPAATAVTRTSADARGMLAGAGDQGDLVAQAMQSGRAQLPPLPAPTGMSVATAARPTGITSVPTSASAALPAVQPGPGPLGRMLGAAGRGAASLAGGVVEQLKKPEVLASVAGGAADVIGSSQDRAVQEQRLKLEEEQMRLERERQERLAQLLMPLFQQQVSQYSSTR